MLKNYWFSRDFQLWCFKLVGFIFQFTYLFCLFFFPVFFSFYNFSSSLLVYSVLPPRTTSLRWSSALTLSAAAVLLVPPACCAADHAHTTRSPLLLAILTQSSPNPFSLSLSFSYQSVCVRACVEHVKNDVDGPSTNRVWYPSNKTVLPSHPLIWFDLSTFHNPPTPNSQMVTPDALFTLFGMSDQTKRKFFSFLLYFIFFKTIILAFYILVLFFNLSDAVRNMWNLLLFYFIFRTLIFLQKFY